MRINADSFWYDKANFDMISFDNFLKKILIWFWEHLVYINAYNY